VNPNGTFDLCDKTQNRRYPGLHYFEDTGDTGNYWAYYPPYENQTHVTLGSSPRIWMAENGPLRAVIVTEHRLGLPARADEPVYGVRGPNRRSGETKPVVIRSELILRKEARRLDIRTTVDNTVENHRLRAAFPSGIAVEYSHAGGHFCVDRRPLISERDAGGCWFNEMQTLPMSRFVDAGDGQTGLALLSDRITEYELRDDPAHTLYLTLFRAMGNMIVTGWECVNRFPKQKGSQLLFPMTFEYGVFPHSGDWTNGVCPEARRYELPLGFYQTMGGGKGTLPLSFGFCTISESPAGHETRGSLPENALVVSCLKKAEDRQIIILRIYNPVPEEKTGTIRFAFPLKSVWETDLNEKRGKPLPVQDGCGFTFRCVPNKILTFEMEWNTAASRSFCGPINY
jgi:mannosylglycerate hydrolase